MSLMSPAVAGGSLPLVPGTPRPNFEISGKDSLPTLKVPGIASGSLSRPVPGVHRVSSSVPPSAAPPCSSSGSEDALPSVRRGPLQDFDFPEVFWVFLLFNIYFIQV